MIPGYGEMLRNAAAASAQMRAYQNAVNRDWRDVPPVKAGLFEPPRTTEQIQRQLDERLSALEAEAAQPERLWPCKTCRFRGEYSHHCANPLVLGFSKEATNWDWDKDYQFKDRLSALCGPEKVLWRPRLTRWQRFAQWIIDRLGA